jgi:hypothetical protein
VRAGQPVSVAVIGGSISVGHGAVTGRPWVVRFYEWVNATFPVASATEAHNLRNGAAQGTMCGFRSRFLGGWEGFLSS